MVRRSAGVPSRGPPQAVVAGTIRDRLVAQPQALGGQDGDGRGALVLSGEDVEDHVGRVHALAQRLGAGHLDRGQPVAKHGGEDLDHLAIAVDAAGELAPDAVESGRQRTQSLKGAPFRSAPGLRASTGT